MFDARPRRFDPFAAGLVVYAAALGCFGLLVGYWNPPGGVLVLIVAGLIAAMGAGVQRGVRE